jgi:hypothetical protein
MKQLRMKKYIFVIENQINNILLPFLSVFEFDKLIEARLNFS